MLIPEIIEDLLVKYTLRNNDPSKEEPPLSRRPDEVCIFAVQRDLDELDDRLAGKVYQRLRETLASLASFGIQDIKRSDIVAALRQGLPEVVELIKLNEEFRPITKDIQTR